MRVNNSKRKARSQDKDKDRRSRGRPTVLTPCPFCLKKFGSREFRVHVPECELRVRVVPGEGKWWGSRS